MTIATWKKKAVLEDRMAHLLNQAMSRCMGEKDASCWSCRRDAILKEHRKIMGYAD